MSIYSKSRLELYAYFNPDELYRLKKLDEKWTKFLWIFLGIAIFLHGLFFVGNIIKNLNLAPKEPPPLSIEIVAPKGGAADTGAVKKPVEMVKPTPEPKPKEKPTPKPSEQAKPLPVPQEIPKTETTPTKSATEKSVSTVDSDKYADYLKNPKPPYPMGPYREGIEGTVWLRVEVLEDGTVGQLQVVQSSGNDELDQSALTTVKTWRFNAAVQGGRAAAQFVRIPITFKLHR